MQYMRKTFCLLCLLACVAGCSTGRTAFDKGEKLEREGKLDEAYMKYIEASLANPDIKEYRLRLLKTGEEAARIHMKYADDFLAGKDYESAIREYQTAAALDPSLERAKQQTVLARKLKESMIYTKDGAEMEKKYNFSGAVRAYNKAVELNPDNSEAKVALKRILRTKKTKLDGFELNLKSTRPITLKFRDTRIKDVFNILTRLSGINFVFDETMKDQNITIFLENATFNQALDIITNMNKLGRKVLNESTIIVYPKNPEKIKQYEELVVKTFFLNNLDAKKAINLLRTMLQIKKIYVNEDLNAIVMRDTPEAIEVAQKILEANDQGDAEVLLEVEVIELNKSDEEKFGLVLSQYGVSAIASKNGNFLYDSLTPPSTAFSSQDNLLNLFTWRGFEGFFTVPNATYNFGKTLSNAEVLANPKLRVKNREKSKFTVATREPITTISTSTGTTGYSTNVQYVDVGIKMNAEPTIQINNEINIKLGLEVSSKLNEKTLTDGTTLITIGTRNLDTVLSLKDGETSVIGGLIQATTTKSKQKIFALGDLPLIGPLISGNDNKKDKTELILAITPHIVRLPSVPEPSVASFWSGKEDEPSVSSPYASFAQEPETPPQATPPVGSQAQPSPAIPPAAAVQPPAPTPTPATAPPSPQAGNRAGALSITVPASVAVGNQFAAEVTAANVTNLFSAPFVLTFDKNLLELVGVAEGNFLKQDGKQTVFHTTVSRETGQVSVALNRAANAGGVSGSGTLISALFKAKGQGLAPVGLQNVSFTSPDGSTVKVSPYNVAVNIRK